MHNLKILVVDTSVGIEASEFTNVVSAEGWSKEKVVWVNRPQWAQKDDGLIAIYKTFMFSEHECQCTVTVLPTAIPRNFPLDHMKFPSAFFGMILILDISQETSLKDTKEKLEWSKNGEYEGLGWFKGASLEKLVVVKSNNTFHVSEQQIKKILELDSGTLVYFFDKDIPYTKEFIISILRTFVDAWLNSVK